MKIKVYCYLLPYKISKIICETTSSVLIMLFLLLICFIKCQLLHPLVQHFIIFGFYEFKSTVFNFDAIKMRIKLNTIRFFY